MPRMGCVATATPVAARRWSRATYVGRRRPSSDPPNVQERTSALAEDAANHESDIGGAFTEPAHEVGEPFTPEWNVDADPVTLLMQRVLQVPPDAIEHLEFVG